MAAPTITQPSFPDGTLQASPPLFWLKADGTLCLVNDTTPLPVTGSFTATVDSEFAAAAALNGTWAKTTVTTIGGAAAMLSDGTNLILAVGGTGVDSTAVQRVSLATNVALPTGSNVIGHVVVDTAPTTAVTGTFFQATQPVSAATLPLPSGAATSALQAQVTPSLNNGVMDTGTQRVVLANDQVANTVAFTFQNAAVATGNGTQATVLGYASVSIQITGITTATLVPEISIDNSNWVTAQGVNTINGTIYANGIFHIATSGVKYLRIRISAYTSGTITVTGIGIVGAISPSSLIIGSEGAVLRSAGGGYLTVGAGFTAADSFNNTSFFGPYNSSGGSNPTAAGTLLYNGASWDRLRTPNIVKTVSATASGNTSLWAATSAKKHRIMRLKIDVTADAATAGGADIVVDIQDVTTTTGITQTIAVPATALNLAVITTGVAGGWTSGWIDLGNGILQATANTAINVNLSAALTSGAVRVVIAGTDE